MKILTACLLALGTALSAAAAQPPPSPCGGLSCTPRMLAIETGFEAARGFSAAELPLLASGECYHLSVDYDPETTHYGMVFLESQEGRFFLGGEFAFFYSENPYREWTIEQARKNLPHLYNPNHALELAEGFAFSDQNPGGDEMWLYWLRRDDASVYVMAQWGTRQRVLCQMSVQ